MSIATSQIQAVSLTVRLSSEPSIKPPIFGIPENLSVRRETKSRLRRYHGLSEPLRAAISVLAQACLGRRRTPSAWPCACSALRGMVHRRSPDMSSVLCHSTGPVRMLQRTKPFQSLEKRNVFGFKGKRRLSDRGRMLGEQVSFIPSPTFERLSLWMVNPSGKQHLFSPNRPASHVPRHRGGRADEAVARVGCLM